MAVDGDGQWPVRFWVPAGAAEKIGLIGWALKRTSELVNSLDRAFVQKDALLYMVKSSMELDNLRRDPRYKAFLKKMNLPE